MRRTVLAAAVALFLTTTPSFAQTHSRARTHTTRATTTLQALIHDNLHEVAVLRSQLPYLRRDTELTGIWNTMIQEHQATADQLARTDRRLGARPVVTVPRIRSRAATPRTIYTRVYSAHIDTLHKLHTLEAKRQPAVVQQSLHMVSNVVRHHIDMLGSVGLKRHWWRGGGSRTGIVHTRSGR